MNSLATHYHQMIGLDDDWTINSVELDLETQTLALGLALEFMAFSRFCVLPLNGAIQHLVKV